MYHNIQNNIHDYQKLKNFNIFFGLRKYFINVCVVNFSMLLHMSSRLKIILKNMFVGCVCIPNTHHRTYKKYQIIYKNIYNLYDEYNIMILCV